MNAVRITKAHLRTGDSGVVRQMSMATNRNDGTVRIHHRSIAPSSTQTDYGTGIGSSGLPDESTNSSAARAFRRSDLGSS